MTVCKDVDFSPLPPGCGSNGSRIPISPGKLNTLTAGIKKISKLDLGADYLFQYAKENGMSADQVDQAAGFPAGTSLSWLNNNNLALNDRMNDPAWRAAGGNAGTGMGTYVGGFRSSGTSVGGGTGSSSRSSSGGSSSSMAVAAGVAAATVTATALIQKVQASYDSALESVGSAVSEHTELLSDMGTAASDALTSIESAYRQFDVSNVLSGAAMDLDLPSSISVPASLRQAGSRFGVHFSDVIDNSLDAGRDIFEDVTSKFNTLEDMLSELLKEGTADLQLEAAYLAAQAETLGARAFIDPPGSIVGGGTGVSPPGGVPVADPVPNVLHAYSSYTYNISLSALSVSQYNDMVENDVAAKTEPLMTSSVLMASGGANNEDFKRNPIFKRDFFIENLVMDSIIGQTQYNQGSNVLSIDFEIHEPYGITLIDRLLALATQMDYENYIEIPYVLRIQFMGYDKDGVPIGPIPNTIKFIPITIINIKTSVTETGAKYKVKAIATNHLAFKQTVATVPTNISVATENIEQFFNGVDNGQNKGMYKGLAQIINEYNEKQVTNGSGARTVADQVHFEIHDYIKQYKINLSNLKDVPEKVIGDDAAKQNARARTNPNAAPQVAVNQMTNRFNTGTSVISIINTIMRNSRYVLDQITLPDEVEIKDCETDGKQPLRWFKIIPKYKLLDFDEKIQRFAYDVTYVIVPYEIYGQRLPIAPQAKPENISKVYDYYFTGQNQDIIDLQLDFNYMFFQGLTYNSDTLSEAKKSPSQTQVIDRSTQATPPEKSSSKDVTPNRIERLGSNQKDGGHGFTSFQPKTLLASDLANSLMTTSKADMLSMTITVLGDPSLIKQDDLLYMAHELEGMPTTPNGSIIQDNGEVYIKLRFLVSDDRDPVTGLATFLTTVDGGSTSRLSVMSGVFRILKVKNKFSDGKFTQELSCLRVFNQEECINTFETEDKEKTSTVSNSVNTNVGQADVAGLYKAEAGQVDETETDLYGGEPVNDAAINAATANRVSEIDWSKNNKSGATPPTPEEERLAREAAESERNRDFLNDLNETAEQFDSADMRQFVTGG